MLPLLECITRSSSLSKEELKLFAIANLIFRVSEFFESLPFKYGIILLRYSSTVSVLFLSPLLSKSI